MPKPSIHDIARLAGVSPSTVSNALNGRGRVAEETAARVREIAAAQGYVPSLAAKNLREMRTRFVGVLVPSLGDEFHAAVVEGIERRLADEGLLCIVRCTGDSTEVAARAVRTLEQRQVEGFMYVGGATELTLPSVKLPVVLVDREPAPSGGPVLVGSDRRALVREAAGLLFSRGCTQVALLNTGSARLVEGGSLLYQGYIEALDEANRPLERNLVIEEQRAESAEEAAETALRTRLRFGLKLDGVVALNDAMALGAVRALEQAGLAPGTDVRVIGLGNSGVARASVPSISSVERQPEAHAQAAANAFLSLIVHAGAHLPNAIVPHAIIERDTTLGRHD